MPSQYTAENVCVSGGGRAALTRAAASLGTINLGHFLPDYTAYEELLDIFQAFTPIPILLEGERGYAFSADDLRREVLGRGLVGDPRCRTRATRPASSSRGEELERVGRRRARARLHAALRRVLLALHLDRRAPAQLPVESAARYVEDVDHDPVVIFDGLTKNWRYPGWRVTWTVGPKQRRSRRVASAGSFLDGGGSKPLQRAAIPLLDDDARRSPRPTAIQTAFREKRDRMLAGLERIGVRIDRAPDGTFYVLGQRRRACRRRSTTA